MNYKLRRIARYLILAARKDDYLKRLKSARPDLDAERTAQELLKLNNPKKEKMALHWICKGTLELPNEKEKLERAYEIVDRLKLDFQEHDSPEELLDSNSSRIKRHIDKINFDPRKERAFSNPYNAGAGVVVYQVDESRECQLAVRRAVDASWGIFANPWCMISRTAGEENIKFMDEEEWFSYSEDERRELDLDILEPVYDHWEDYGGIPKRIAFQNGKLLAFCASKNRTIEWWDRKNKSKKKIPASGAVDDQEFIRRQTEEFYKLKMLASSSNQEILTELAKNEDYKIRMAVAKNESTPIEVLEILSRDKNEKVVIGVVGNKNSNEKILSDLVKHKSPEVRKRIAKNENSTVEMLDRLSRDKDYNVLLSVAGCQRTPASILSKILSDAGEGDHRIRATIALNSNTSRDMLEILLSSKDERVKNALAQRKDLPEEIAVKLADSVSYVRESLARYQDLPYNILKKLSKDVDYSVRMAVSKNEGTPVDILIDLLKDKDERVVERVLLNEKMPTEVLKKHAMSKDENLRAATASNPKTPESILKRLSKDESNFVRKNVASNEKTPFRTLKMLSEDENELVRSMVAVNPKTPASLLEELYRKNKNLYCDVADNQNVPAYLLKEILLENVNSFYVVDFLEHPNMTQEVLMQLANENKELREIIINRDLLKSVDPASIDAFKKALASKSLRRIAKKLIQ